MSEMETEMGTLLVLACMRVGGRCPCILAFQATFQ